MRLWTDVIDPATLTGYARAALADMEQRRGSLARWLPNREVGDIVVRFLKGQTGLIPIAKFRSYDAEPEIGARQPAKRVTLELPAIGQNIPVGEYEQLRLRSGGDVDDARAVASILNTTRQVVRAVVDAVEYMRGIVLVTGKATIEQGNFQLDDDFGRPGDHTDTAQETWEDPTVSRLEYLESLSDRYVDANGEPPGAMVMSTKVFRAMAKGDEFATLLVNGSSRPATREQVQAQLDAAGLPPVFIHDRRVNVDGVTTRVIPDTGLLMLPAPVEPDEWEGTDLGATFWGQTLTSTDPEWGIEEAEQPGIVAGVYRHQKPPMGIEIISDAIGLPVLANAERSLYATVMSTD